MKTITVTLAATAALLGATGSPAHAQTPATAASDCERYYQIAEYARAIDCWKASYLSTPDPADLYRIAQSYRYLGDHDNAVIFYRRFLHEKGPSYSGRKIVEQLLESEEEKAAAQAASRPATQQAVPPIPSGVPAPSPAPAPVPVVPRSPAVVSAGPTRERPWYANVGGDLLLIGGAAGLLGGGAFVALAVRDGSAAGSAPNVVEYHSLHDRSVREEVIGFSAVGLGAVLVASGIVWDARLSGEREVSLAAAPTTGGFALDVAATF